MFDSGGSDDSRDSREVRRQVRVERVMNWVRSLMDEVVEEEEDGRREDSWLEKGVAEREESFGLSLSSIVCRRRWFHDLGDDIVLIV